MSSTLASLHLLYKLSTCSSEDLPGYRIYSNLYETYTIELSHICPIPNIIPIAFQLPANRRQANLLSMDFERII